MSLLDTHADRLDWREDGTVVFTLRKPLRTATGEIATLTVARPKLEDLLANEKATGDDFTKTAMIIARLTGVKLAELDEADAGDNMVLAEVMAKMLEYGEDGNLLDRHDARLTITEHDASLQLLGPLKTANGEEDAIVVRRPSLKEVRTNQGKTMAASVKLLAVLTGLGPNALGKLDAVDGMILSALINDFLGKSRQPTPGNP
jgi:hypothetical protein